MKLIFDRIMRLKTDFSKLDLNIFESSMTCM